MCSRAVTAPARAHRRRCTQQTASPNTHRPPRRALTLLRPSSDPQNFPRLPKLPPNAAYLRTERCTGTWGAIDAVARALPVAAHEYFLVVDSSVRGPFLPPYVGPLGLHWTEAFTHKLTGRVKLVGSAISCEGAPRRGDAAGEWRGSPYVLPYAWATDRAGWALLAAEPGVFRCHASPWDARFSSDAGASLAVLRAGFGLDCLLARYQGVDWSQPAAWGCNARVRPDLEGHYDGASITPYETIFVPVSEGAAAARWSFVEAAARYEAWADARLRPPERRPGVAGNAWIADHWAAKGTRLVAANARGPGCFDFAYYAARGRDLAPLAGDAAALWEHFVLLGQFQGRRHRWTCPLAVGNSYRVAYVLARGPRCFDWGFYAEQHPDLGRAGIATPAALFQHFAEFGQFERRKIRFVCADTVAGLPAGFDTGGGVRAGAGGAGGAAAAARAEEEAAAAEAAAAAAEARAALLAAGGDADDPVQQALKGALVAEAANDAFRAAAR